jgi:hypothetical protein
MFSTGAVTGYDWLAPGTACVAYVWWLWCLLRQRHYIQLRRPLARCAHGERRPDWSLQLDLCGELESADLEESIDTTHR